MEAEIAGVAFGLVVLANSVAKREAGPCEAAAPGLGCVELTKPTGLELVGLVFAEVKLLELGPNVNEGTLDLGTSFEFVLASGNSEGLNAAEAAGVEVACAAWLSAKTGLFSAGVGFSAVAVVSLLVWAEVVVDDVVLDDVLVFESSAIERWVSRDLPGSRIAMIPAVTKAKIKSIKMMPLDQCSHHERESFSVASGTGRITGVGRIEAGASKLVVGEETEAATDAKLGRAPCALPDELLVPKGVAAKAEPARLPATATPLATVPATAPVTAPAT